MAAAGAALALLMFLNAHMSQLSNKLQSNDIDDDNSNIFRIYKPTWRADWRQQDLGNRVFYKDVQKDRYVDGKDVECASGAYPPDISWKVPERIINLDLPPSERWREVATEYSDDIKSLLSAFRNLTHPIFHGLLFKLVDKYAPKLVDTLPYPFPGEMKGIANATGLALGEVALFNVFYEIFTVCTSIVGQTPTGRLFHGRNLDFGLFLGWDYRNNTWLTTEILRKMTVQLDFQRGGQTLFKSTTFVGYVGVLTGMKPGAFSLTVDERFNFVGGYVGVIEWLLGRRSGNWMSFITRSVLENATSYEQSQEILSESKLLSPVYFILGGNQTGQASVITRGLKFVDVWDLSSSKNNWYLVQTNYDHWKKPPSYDDRRTPAKHCLEQLGQENLTMAGLFNVLSTEPVKNKLTTYTTVMEVEAGAIESYLQYCNDPTCPEF